MKYAEMTSEEKLSYLTKEYKIGEKSFHELAELADTYPNRLRRDAQKFKIPIRNKSEAQKSALASGRLTHPTKGKTITDAAKAKIGEKKAEYWANLTPEQKEAAAEVFRKNWDKVSDEDRAVIRSKAARGVRKAAKDGSKLEIHVKEQLMKAGYVVEYHKEHWLMNDRLQVDIFLPSLTVAIEIDGPSHFSPIWGEDVLLRNQKADAQKNGLLLAKGFTVVRVKQTQGLSQKFQRDVMKRLLATLEEIAAGTDKKLFEI